MACFPGNLEVVRRNRILGIDPGSYCTGFAVIEVKGVATHSIIGPSSYRIVDAGVLRASSKDKIFPRIGKLHSTMRSIVSEHKPDVSVLEKVFLGPNVVSALTLGQVRGAFIAASIDSGVAVDEIASTSVKKIIVGKGHASKEEVSAALGVQVGFVRGSLPFDVSDALAIALAYGIKFA